MLKYKHNRDSRPLYLYFVLLIFASNLSMATPQSVSFYTLGCKLNYSETSAIGRMFEDKGYAVNRFEDGADICVINTCSVKRKI